MNGRYRPQRFHTQVLLLFLLAVLLPVIVLSVYLYDDIVSASEAKLANQLETEGNQWLAGYQSRRAQVESLAYMVGNNPTIINYLNSHGVRDADIIKTIRQSFRPMLEWLMITNEMVYRIHFFTDNPELPQDRFVTKWARHEGDEWFQELRAQAADGRLLPVGRAYALPYETVLEYPLVATYQEKMSRAPDAYLQLDIAAQWLYGDISLAVDRETGRILYSALDASLAGADFDLSVLSRQGGVLGKAVSLGGDSYYVGPCGAEGEPVLFLHLIPAAAVADQLRNALNSYLIFCIALFILMLALAWYITTRVTRRVDQIGGMVRQIAQGQYLVSYTPRYHDEIDQLGQDVRDMGLKMDRLVNQGLRQTLLTKEAEFRALQAQMNPHFIFNTLESFQMLAELEGLKTLSDMMALLGKLVRYNLEHAPTVPLRMEIENVADYIAVQNLNWNGRIHLDTQLDESLLDREVLRLLLQPVVENAIVHGMPPTGELHISITIDQGAEGLLLRVANDGKPMTEEDARRLDGLLREASASPVSTGSRSIALQNIQRRLIIQYGAACLIRLGPSGKQGFSVEFVLPGERSGDPCAS